MRTWGAVLALAAWAAAGEGVWKDYQSGVEAFQKGELSRAEALLKAASADERVKDAHYYLGVIQIRKGETAAGMASLAKVPEEYPTYAYAQRELGMGARGKGEWEKACGHFEASAKARPSADAYLELGRAQTDAKKHEAAEANLKKAEELSKGNVEVHEALARVYLETGKYAAALERYEAIRKTVPSDVSARFGTAVCLELLDRKADAVRELEALVEKDPAHEGALARLISLYGDDAENAEAKARLQKRLAWFKAHPVKSAPPGPPEPQPSTKPGDRR